MGDLLRLKTKLMLKKLRRLTEAEVHENFGYCPNDSKYFDGLMDQMHHWASIAEDKYRDLYIEHINKV